MRFLHIADVHLGNQQYNLARRFNDFGQAFLDAVDLAVERNVDAVVIAGDLFHKASVEPKTLLIAEEGLKRLQAASIEAIAVHGNHDRARYLAQSSWLDYLAERGLFHLLTPVFDEGRARLEPEISYVDVDGVRFIGVPWLGAAAARVLHEVADCCAALPADGIACNVLVTHSGVEGQMPHMPGGLSFAELAPLRAHVQYLALGHLHKPYAVDGWVYNPGSLETCSFDEAEYERGVYLVDVARDGTYTAAHLVTPKRPFHTIPVMTDLCRTPDELVETAHTAIRQAAKRIAREIKAAPDRNRALPVVRVVLRGHLTFDRARLDLEGLRRIAQEEIETLLVRVENRTSPLQVETLNPEGMDRQELERAVLEDLVRSDTRFSGNVTGWAGLMQQVKAMVLEGADPAAIFDLLDEGMPAAGEGEHVDH